jgi:multicomponent Na+:H+ antiporter subunit C
MQLFMAITIGVLFAGGTYLILRPNLIRIVMGFGLYSNGTNLLLIACGGYVTDGEAPFMTDGVDLNTRFDPLPPDIILTAIVISFAVAALFLTLCYRVYLDQHTDNPDQLPNHEDPESIPGLAAGDEPNGPIPAPADAHGH